jgi:hypothetical protein
MVVYHVTVFCDWPVTDITTEIFWLTDTEIYDDSLDRMLQIVNAKYLKTYM